MSKCWTCGELIGESEFLHFCSESCQKNYKSKSNEFNDKIVPIQSDERLEEREKVKEGGWQVRRIIKSLKMLMTRKKEKQEDILGSAVIHSLGMIFVTLAVFLFMEISEMSERIRNYDPTLGNVYSLILLIIGVALIRRYVIGWIISALPLSFIFWLSGFNAQTILLYLLEPPSPGFYYVVRIDQSGFIELTTSGTISLMVFIISLFFSYFLFTRYSFFGIDSIKNEYISERLQEIFTGFLFIPFIFLLPWLYFYREPYHPPASFSIITVFIVVVISIVFILPIVVKMVGKEKVNQIYQKLRK